MGEVSTWAVEQSKARSLHSGKPGGLVVNATFSFVLDLWREELKETPSQAIAHSPVLDIMAATRVAPKSKGRSLKSRRLQRSQSVLLINVDFDNLPAVMESSVKYSLGVVD